MGQAHLVLLGPGGTLAALKLLSTPEDYGRAVLAGIRELLAATGLGGHQVKELTHATTVGTNAVVERKGARTALLTTQGFRDVLELGRYRVPRLYDLRWRKPEPLVPRRYRFEVPERLDHRGRVLRPVDLSAVDAVARVLAAEGVEAVAVCLLHSYRNPAHELAVAERLRAALPGIHLSLSHRVLPRIQEYERTSTTVVNAYVAPIFERYLGQLLGGLAALGIRTPLHIMQSAGGLMTAEATLELPVHAIESGPAAGVVGALRLAGRLGLGDIITLDMGGTTAKAALIEGGRVGRTAEYEVGGDVAQGHRLLRSGGYVVCVPALDVAEVGAGGGSIAWLDAAGGLRVGPRSAGASPGPACYGFGGQEPTVTDANLVLGYLNPEGLLGGRFKLDFGRAEAALGRLARGLSLSAAEAAFGVHAIANASMVRALKSVSTERGRDPRRFTLFAFGGSGPAHAAGLARALGIRRVVVPPAAGMFSALGLLFADVEYELTQAFYEPLFAADLEALNGVFGRLLARAGELLGSAGFGVGERSVGLYVDVQYAGQNGFLTVPVPDWPVTVEGLKAVAAAFAAEHERTYGYRSDEEPVQLVALRVVATGVSPEPRVPPQLKLGLPEAKASGRRRAYFGPGLGWLEAAVVGREGLGREPVEGPLIVEEYDSTTVVPPGWRVRLDEGLSLVLEADSQP
jgi:N-methylhydantoinase A